MSVAGAALPSAQTAPAAPAKPKFVRPVRGVAEIAYMKPTVKVVGDEVVTSFRIKNLSPDMSIAGLKVAEFWYDKAGQMLPGDSKLVRQPVNPGEVVTVELRTPKNTKMDRNTYQFTHANGTCKPTVVPKL
jgi:hypothetical protein